MLFQILWTTSFYIKLYFLLFYIFCWTAFSDKLHFLTNCIFWQTTFSDKLRFLLNCIFWQTAFSDKLHFLTNYIFLQTAFSVVSRLRRMVTNIGCSHVSRLILSYPKHSQYFPRFPYLLLLSCKKQHGERTFLFYGYKFTSTGNRYSFGFKYRNKLRCHVNSSSK
jgi:hypothetical protein